MKIQNNPNKQITATTESSVPWRDLRDRSFIFVPAKHARSICWLRLFSWTSINCFHGFLTRSDRESSFIAEWRARIISNDDSVFNCFIKIKDYIVKTTRSLLAEWNTVEIAETFSIADVKVFRLFIYLIVLKHRSRGRRITKNYKFKERKDITPTRGQVSSEWRLFSKMNFVTFRSTYHSSCYWKAGP